MLLKMKSPRCSDVEFTCTTGRFPVFVFRYEDANFYFVNFPFTENYFINRLQTLAAVLRKRNYFLRLHQCVFGCDGYAQRF